MDSFRSCGAGLIAIAVFVLSAIADAASVLSQTNTGSTARAQQLAISPTLEYDQRPIGGKGINVADSGENRGLGWIDGIVSAFSLYKQEEEEGSARVEALSRDSSSKSLTIPLLTASTRQSVVVGARQFHIAWVGGKPSFAVELIGPSGATVASWPQTAEHSVAATVNLEEGFYELHVTDASGQPVFGAFEATPQPPVVDRRGVEQLPSDLGAALLAARLADIDDGAWQLEAYERLTTEPSGDAARIIAKRLAQGLSVSELRAQGTPPR